MLHKQMYYYALSFIAPIIIFTSVMMWFGVSPFGSNTILIQDMYGQYIQFYHYYYDIFYTGKSVFYSWEAGLGMNFFGIFGYYLSSFLSPIVLLFDPSYMPEAILVLILVKLGLAGLTFSLYIYSTFKIEKLINVSFAVMYALMSYNMVYFFNVMWLDGILLLPLILMGIEKLLRTQQFYLLAVSLAVLFISNFYIAYMIGLFAVIYGINRYIITDIPLRLCGRYLFRFVAAATVAAGISAAVTLPTFLALSATANTELVTETNANLSFTLSSGLLKLFNGSYDTLKSVGQPNIFAGTLPLLLLPVFFALKRIPLKEKLSMGLLLLLFVVSFGNPFMDMLWHGFNQPDWFPYRYTFLFSFLLIIIAVRVLPILQQQDKHWIIISLVISSASVIWLSVIPPYPMGHLKATMNMGLLVLFTSYLLFSIRMPDRKVMLSLLLAGLVIIDVTLNAYLLVRDVRKDMYAVSRSQYSDTAHDQGIFRQLDQWNIQKPSAASNHSSTAFYRVESNVQKTLNDAMRFGYKGISHFSSLMNYDLVHTLDRLGYATYSDTWIKNAGNTLLTDAIFGLKYRIDQKEMNVYGYKEVKTAATQKRYVYENTNALPLGFMTFPMRHALGTIDESNPLEKQNKIIKEMTGIQDQNGAANVWVRSTPDERSLNHLQAVEAPGDLRYTPTSEAASISFRFARTLPGQWYLYMPFIHGEIDLTINGVKMGVFPDLYRSSILDLGHLQNEELLVTLDIRSELAVLQDIQFYRLDTATFEQMIQQLQQQPFELEYMDSRRVKGHIDVQNAGMLFLSIPYDKGWTIHIDGIKTEALQVVGSFIGLDLPIGKHAIDMSYRSPGATAGSVISILSVVLLILLWRRKEKR